ncbi:MAG: glycosyltransferase [Acidimicrobiales bacterium]|nr:glycosyltransferase [Acidimicrobiales bacterium]
MTNRIPMVRVAVLNWNGLAFTPRCLEHLLATNWPSDRLEVMVIDNASSDGSAEEVARRFPQVRVVQNGANLGFVGLNTAFVDLDGIDYVALVNNDAFVEPGWLAPLVATLEADPQLGAASARMIFAPRFHELVIESPTFRPPGDARSLGVQIRGLAVRSESVFGRAQFIAGCFGEEPRPGGTFRWTSERAVIRVPVPADRTGAQFGFVDVELQAESDKLVILRCGAYRVRALVGPEPKIVRVPYWGEPFDVIQNAGSVLIDDGFGADRGFLAIDEGQYDKPCDLFNWCGGAVLLRRQFIEHAGPFDERFFLYYEDTDWSWRGQKFGWRYRYVPDSRVRHVHGGSGGEGSEVFHFHVERNRLLMLAKNAPARMAAEQVARFVTATASYALRDVLLPLLRGRRPPLRYVRIRARAFSSFLRLAPAMLRERRGIRQRQVVPDEVLASRWISRKAWSAHERRIVETAGHYREVTFPPMPPFHPLPVDGNGASRVGGGSAAPAPIVADLQDGGAAGAAAAQATGTGEGHAI